MPYFNQANEPTVSDDRYNITVAAARVGRSNRKIQALKPPHGWIPIATRIPPSSGPYLVLLRGHRYRMMDFEAQNAAFSPKGLSPMVTHWMPLPPLPE